MEEALKGLKPCTCGSTNLGEFHEDHIDYAHIQCKDCGYKGPIRDQIGNWKRPYDAWDARMSGEDVADFEL